MTRDIHDAAAGDPKTGGNVAFADELPGLDRPPDAVLPRENDAAGRKDPPRLQGQAGTDQPAPQQLVTITGAAGGLPARSPGRAAQLAARSPSRSRPPAKAPPPIPRSCLTHHLFLGRTPYAELREAHPNRNRVGPCESTVSRRARIGYRARCSSFVPSREETPITRIPATTIVPSASRRPKASASTPTSTGPIRKPP